MAENVDNLDDFKKVEPGISTKAKYIKRWIEEFIAINGLVYNQQHSNYTLPGQKAKSRKDMVREVAIEALEYGYPPSIKGTVADIWATKCAREHEKHLKIVRESVLVGNIPPDRKNDAMVDLRRLVYYITGKTNDLDIACLRQFIWSVKKNLADKTHEISHVMMPVFFGGQDTGKTTIMNWLCSPLQELSINSDFNVFKDERNLKAFQMMYIIKLDEMGKAKETAVESIKKIMSNTNLLQREFHSQDEFAKIQSRATFIAATNRPLTDVIVDDEMRRFWQIEFAPYVWVNKHWDEIKAIDWRLLWDSVDIDNDREPADEVWHLFKKTQAIYADGSHIEDFIKEAINTDSDDWHEGIELYKAYQLWCEYHRLTKQLTRKRFTSKIKPSILSKHSNGIKFNYTLKDYKNKPSEEIDILQDNVSLEELEYERSIREQ